MKRIIAIALLLVMTVTIFAGCKDKTGDSSTTPPAKTDETDTGEEVAPPSGDVITIDINTADGNVAFDPANDALAAFIVEKFGIQFQPRAIADTVDYVLLASSGDLPEVFYNEPLYYVENYLNFIDGKLVRAIPDEMLEKFPNIKGIIETSDICNVTKDTYDGNYLIPKPDSMDRSLYIAERRGIFYRKDWAEAVGITERPTNTEELYTMLKAFTFDDPDGNGVQDTWGLSAAKAGELRIWFIAWGVDNQNWVKGEDGKWIHGQMTPGNIEPLKYFRKLFEEGILDPEFAQIDHVQAQQKLAGGTVGAITRNADTDWINGVIVEQFGAANPGVNPFEKVDLIPILSKDASSKPYMHEYLLDMCATQFNGTLSDEKLEKYLAFHEWSMTEEGVNYKLGFEGKDWEVDADGNKQYIKVDGANPVVADLYPSIGLLNMPSWGFELACDYTWPRENYGIYAKEVRDLSAEARDLRNPNAFPNDMRIKLIATPAKIDVDGYEWGNAVAEIIMGTEPVEDMFNQMVDKAMASGFTEAIEEVNAYTTEHGID